MINLILRYHELPLEIKNGWSIRSSFFIYIRFLKRREWP
jgi:hypothetical protein